jgi:hypothetical protein
VSDITVPQIGFWFTQSLHILKWWSFDESNSIFFETSVVTIVSLCIALTLIWKKIELFSFWNLEHLC